MDFWTNDPKADKITSVLGQVEEVKAAMVKVCQFYVNFSIF